MSKNASILTVLRRLNLKAIIWDLIAVCSVITAIVFILLWINAKSELSQLEAKNATEQNEANEVIENKQKLITKKETDISLLKNTLQSKESTISSLKKDVANANYQANRWMLPLMDALEVGQDVYAMKWAGNSQILSDMENHSARTVEVCKKWEKLCKSLERHPELAPQRAKLKVRLAQAYSSLGMISKIKLDGIDWKAAGLEHRQAETIAHIWLNVATQLSRAGKNKDAQLYLPLAKESVKQIPTKGQHAQPEKKAYFFAKIDLLEGDFIAPTKPEEALKLYISATKHLQATIAALPENPKLRTAFIQACLDGAMLSDANHSAGHSEQLKKQAFEQIKILIRDHPNLKAPHLLNAEIQTLEAEEHLRNGEHYKASKSLEAARASITSGGGSIINSAAVDATQAFIHWDHGERTKAMSIIGTAISEVTRLSEAEPNNQEALYRLASLYWVRSSMQIVSAKAIGDGQTAVKTLAHLLKIGAGKREASTRRMIAIIYGDIGHQAYSSGQRVVAKQYFQEAHNQWKYLIGKWGECDEYTEGMRWCAWRLKSLK